MFKKGTILEGALLVAGTTIGGGMLALPVLTSPGGFIPSFCIYILCYLFMTFTGLLFLEISLQMPEGVNILSMAESTLGRWGKLFALVLYIFLFYCLTIAYLVGCGDILSGVFHLSRSLGPLLFTLCVIPLLYAGTRLIGKVNYLCMAALAVLYASFVLLGASDIKIDNLMPKNWALSLLGLPVAFTSFAYQGIIPTLVSHMGRQPAKIRKSIWIGTTISLITYILWQWLILGIVPFAGEHGLQAALAQGRSAIYPLQYHLQNPSLFLIGGWFAFLALLTSFFGVSLGLIDFLADGLKIHKTAKGKWILLALVLAIPLIIATLYPNIFLMALDYAGGYGCALLLGLLPIMMAFVLRRNNPDMERQLRGGFTLLAIMCLFVLLELAVEILR